MRRRVWVGIFLAAALVTVVATTGGAQPPPTLAPHIEGEVIVKFRAGTPQSERAEIRGELGIVELQPLDAIRAEHTVIRGMTVAEALERYRDDPRVEYIEPNYILSAQALPNDPAFPLQWGLHNVGQTGGDAGSDIMAAEAWDVFTGTNDIVVAVIDSGIDHTHPDLAANIFINTGEIPNNGVDDDGNGFIDDIRGWNFIIQNNNAVDDNGHGTHVAGIIGAVGNNSLGISGVNWRVRLMPLKFLNSGGLGSTAGAVSCIEYATLMGVDVMNASWGGSAPSQALADAVAAAAAADIVFVAAAGNGNPGVNIDLQPFLPASLDLPNIISVGASDDRDRLWTGSNFGVNGVDLVAPGVSIYSTVPGGGYVFLNGTSMAVPHVVGGVALLRGRFPGLSAVETRSLLLERTDQVNALQGLIAGGRRLNAFLPIAVADDVAPARIETLSTFNPESSRIDLSWIATGDDGNQGTAARYDVRYSTQVIDAANFGQAKRVPDLPDPRPAGSEEQLRVGGLKFDTTYYFALRAFDEFGNASPLSNVAVGTTSGPPAIAAAPTAFSAELFTGQTATRTLSLDNTGVGEYVFSIEIDRPATGVASGAPFGLAIWTPGVRPPAANPAAQSYGPAFEPAAEGVPAPLATGVADGLRIMILQSGADVSQIKGLLSVMDDVALVDELDIRLATPSLADLEPFDAVIMVANNPVTDQVTLGNVLADYADSGGGVVMTLATLISGWEVRGRFLEEGYYPVEIGSGPIGGSALGTFDASHPIMQGVTDVRGDLLGDLSLAAGAEMVAQWENGEPFVATKRGNVAAINIYVAGNGFWGGDVPRVLRNAVFWTSNTIDWLSTAPRSGTVPAGFGLPIAVTFDAGGLGSGTYAAEIILTGNDPDAPIIRMPAELTVTGAPDVQVLPVTTDFGSLFVGDSATRFLEVSNTGTETALIGSIVSDHAAFSAAAGSLQLAPGQQALLAVTFAPTDAGPKVARLTFASNDPDEPEVGVTLRGTGLIPPRIRVEPGSFAVDLFTGEMATDTLSISNDGGSRLDVSLAVQVSNAQAAGLSAPVSPPLGLSAAPPPTDPGPAGPPGVVVDLSYRAAVEVFGEPFVFSEDFEDGLFDGWNEEQNINIKEVTDEVAANGTSFSYHQINFIPGHFNGIARSFGQQKPSYASFYVRSSDRTENDSYFVVRAINGLESIFFFARDTGVFYCNLDVGGNSSVPYEANTWYFIEFRDIDFVDRHFDYYVNGALIQENIPLRDTGNDEPFWEVDLYNFDDDSEAWWDEILFADEAPALPVEVGPQSLSLDPGESADVTVTFNATGLAGGQVLAHIAVNSNDPSAPSVLVPATLSITSAADIDVSDTVLDWGSVFVGQAVERTLEISNVGFQTLTISQIATDDAAFASDVAALVLEPGETREVVLTFSPPAAGARAATLSIVSDDLDEGLVTVALQALALIPPEIEVSPTAFEQELFTGESGSQTMTLVNNGGSDLAFEIHVDAPDPSVSVGAGPTSPWVDLAPIDGPSAAGAPFTFRDGFEDGTLGSWINAGGTAIKEVTDQTAADGTRYSYHERNAAGGHFTGIYHVLPNTRPAYAAFYVRPGSETTPDGYFALRDANGFEGIFFFAGPDGHFGINSDVGGNQAVPYSAFTWYHIEFRQISWETKTFDYYVNGLLIQEQIPFRNTTLVGGFSRLDLYSFQQGAEAWWDEIVVSTVEPPSPVSVNPISGVIPAGESLAVSVNFNAKNLDGGSYTSEILVESNDPARPQIVATATLTVVEAPDIELTTASLDFAPLFVGLSAEKTLRVLNDGSATLTVTAITGDESDFSFDTNGFELDPGRIRDVVVTFAPSRGGAIAGTMTLTSDDPDEPTVLVALTGEGRLPPEIGVAPEALQQELFTGQTASVPLTLSNTGASALLWQVDFPGGAPPVWLAVEPDDGTLVGAESTTLTVDFDAAGLTGGDYATEIRIESNDPDEPQVTVPVVLRVTSAPHIVLSESRLDFGEVFLETTGSRRLIVSNAGVEALVVAKITVNNLDFAVSTAGFAVPPGGAAEVVVTFTPPGLGTFNGILTLVSNDPDQGSLAVPLQAEGTIPPEVTVDPTAVSADLLSGQVRVQPMSIANIGGSALTFDIVVEARLEVQAAAAEAADPEPWVEVAFRELSPAETSGPPVPLDIGGIAAQAGPVFLADNFEDGDFEGWELGLSEGAREVTGQTAANDTTYSYHESLSSLGHLDGVYRIFGPSQPGYVGFWVRSGNEAAEDAYFVIRDSNGREVIWFFARSTGRFYVNADVGGHELLAYDADRWYHIEFKNINFQTQRFDYYVDGQRIKPGIPFRNFGLIGEMSRVDLYNFTRDAEAWWDEIVIAAQEPFNAVSVRPATGTVPAGGQTLVDVRFDARGLNGGVYLGDILIRTNDPDRPQVVVPVDLRVTGIPDIGVSRTLLEFGAVRLGLPESRSVTVTNFGTDLLTVDSIVVPHPEFTANRTSFELEPLESTAISVTFAPGSTGPRSATMTVTSNDPDRPALTIDLTGFGVIAAGLDVSPAALQEVLFAGQTSTRTLSLTNPGGEPLNYSVSLQDLSAASIPTDLIVFSDDLEGETEGWTTVSYAAEDLWHLTEAHANSPTHSFWCSQPDAGHYATIDPISNAVISPPLDLRGLVAPVSLVFYENYETEPGWDKCMVDVSIDGGTTWTPLRGDYTTAPSGSTEGWVLESLSLTPFIGHIVQVRFYFETLDATNNAFSGWRFDDVRIRSAGAPWLDVTPLAGSIAPGVTEELLVTFTALEGRPVGLYQAGIDIASNDPDTPLIHVPAALRVGAPPRIALPGDTVTLTSSREWVDASETRHRFDITAPPAGAGEVLLEANGDFGEANQRATLTAEAFVLGSAGNTGAGCGIAAGAFELSAQELRALATDGVIDMGVRNSPAVGVCDVNSHTLALSYPAAREQLDLGTVAAGIPATTMLEVANIGDGELQIHSIVSDSPAVSVSPAALSIPAHASALVGVTFAPTAAGLLAAQLTFTSSDPVRGTIALGMVGEARLEPAIATIAPAALVAALPPYSERTRTKTVRLSNTGQADLLWSVPMFELGTAEPSAGSIGPGAFVDIQVSFASADLALGDYGSALVIESNSAGGGITVPLTLHVRESELEHIAVDFSPRFTDRTDTVEISLELKPEYDPHDILVASLLLNDCMAAESSPVSYADLDRDGILELIVQFDLATFDECMPRDPDGTRTVALVGEVEDEAWFTGIAYLRGVVQVGK